jgi:serine/threonine-protein kinase
MDLRRFSPTAFLETVPRDTLEERAFLQARLSSFYRIVCALCIVEVALAVLLFVTVGTSGPKTHILGAHDWLYEWVLVASLALVTFFLWRVTRRGERSETALHAIDAGGSMYACLTYIALGWLMPAYLRPEFHQLACVTVVLAFRAVMVPSSAVRTLAIGGIAVASISVFAFVYYSHQFVAVDAPPPSIYAGYAAVVGSAGVAVTTITSRTLFGLREKVREASQLGQYTLIERIGEGGMGVVYKAKHAMLRRPTAVKLLPADKAGGRSLARFEREVQLTSMLTHPNTIQVYDFGRTPEGTFYYAMEYLDGVTLDMLVELDGAQPSARVIALLAQVCGSLAEAHGVGLIHRDIKPENIVLCERGRLSDVVKVLDFGLVKAVEGPEAAQLSRTGALAGTPQYMAPEAIVSPDTVDARSDLYAVGAVGYFLVTGHHVFEGTTLLEICAHHIHSKPEPPSARLGAAVSSDLEALLLSCLAKSPDDRPRDAEDLRARLLACPEASSWTEAKSRQWWQSHRDTIRDKRAARASLSSSNGTDLGSLILSSRLPLPGTKFASIRMPSGSSNRTE